MTSPPCQGFSLSGLRKGSVLFFNSHEFIQKNKPRFFIFENVKGLLSHDKTNLKNDYGNTFNQWLYYLGGKSINGAPVIFPHENSVPYHIYFNVLNSKEYGIPQNRERVFIVGIRDDEDNVFNWPKKEYLTKKLKDVLEEDADKKYFLSEKAIKGLIRASKKDHKPHFMSEQTNSSPTIDTKVGDSTHYSPYLLVNSANKKGYEVACVGDSINFSVPSSKTRRGRVGKGVAQTLDTACNQATIKGGIRRLTPRECFRLQDFPDTFKFVVSDTQLYKQAGNSISVGVLARIISNMKL